MKFTTTITVEFEGPKRVKAEEITAYLKDDWGLEDPNASSRMYLEKYSVRYKSIKVRTCANA